MFNNLKNILNTIYCLLNLYQMSRLNYYKYSEAHTRYKLNLFIKNIINKVCLIMSMKVL